MGRTTGSPGELANGAAQAKMVEKTRFYDAWIDEPHRSLDGMTPRQAAGHPRAWRKLEVVLKVKEHAERELPAGERYDFDGLRRKLGIGK